MKVIVNKNVHIKILWKCQLCTSFTVCSLISQRLLRVHQPPLPSPAHSVILSMWVRLKTVCPLKWMATGPPPTILTTYPFRSQSTPNLTNSLLIPVGIYMYSTTCPLILITSPAAILNLPINLSWPLDTGLVLTSDNLHFIFLPTPYPSLLPVL